MAATLDNEHVATVQDPEGDKRLYGKVAWRLMPLLIVGYMIAFLDRINIGYAELQMKEDLGLSEVAFATGASVFFIGYFLFEIPSNMALERIGVRKTLLRIMFCWGIVAAGMAFVQSTTVFYVMRFLLGAFEAGFFPGVVLYLTYWFPSQRRGRMLALFGSATALAYLIAGPMSGAILKNLSDAGGLKGWQWLFIIQGLPAAFIGIAIYFSLPDRVADAKWLSPEEKQRLKYHLDHDVNAVATGAHSSPWAMLRDPKVYLLVLVYFMFLGATYSMLFWSPTLIQSWGVKDVFTIGLLGMLPSICAVIGMFLLGRSSDRRMERRWHFFVAAALCAAGIGLTIVTKGVLVPSLVGLCIMAIGQGATTPLFFTAVSDYLPVASAAVGLAFVSSMGNLGPSFLPPILERITVSTGSQTTALMIIAGLYLAAALLLVFVVRPSRAAKAVAEVNAHA